MNPNLVNNPKDVEKAFIDFYKELLVLEFKTALTCNNIIKRGAILFDTQREVLCATN